MKVILLLLLFINSVFSDKYYEFIPSIKGSLYSKESQISFESKCFKKVLISLNINKNNFTVTFRNTGIKHYICMDIYYTGCINFQHINFIPSYKKEYSITSLYKNRDIDINDINFNGYHVFYFNNGVVGTVSSLIYTTQLYIGNNIIFNNINFLKEKMNYNIEKNKNTEVYFNPDNIKTGDIFLVNRLDGFDQLIMWGTGSYIGHTAIASRINGELYILESTDANPYGKVCWDPPYGVIKNKWDRWYSMIKNCSSYISILRLKDNFQLDFSKGNDFFDIVEGLPYGYNNFVFGWIDTLKDNYPNPLSPELLYVLLNQYSKGNDSFPNIYFSQGLNKRLGTNNLHFSEVLFELLKRKIKFRELLTIPEEDKWIYNNKIRPGRSMVCDVFVLSFLKKSGLFKDYQMEVSEFTPKDLYQLKIFNNTWITDEKLTCLNNDSWCQILGEYYMDLNNFNSIDIYSNMNQKCPSIPPDYIRDKEC